MAQLEKMYAVKEVSLLTGWSVDSIRRRIRRGLIKAAKLPKLGKGKHEYFRVSESEVLKLNKPSE